jgi:hypothetical protein
LSSDFQRKHYELIADIISEIPDEKVREDVAKRFANGLAGTNGLFKAERFIARALKA